jgi:hypothetical protein
MDSAPAPHPTPSLGVTGIFTRSADVDETLKHLERISFAPDQITVLTRDGVRTGVRRRHHLRIVMLTLAGMVSGALLAGLIAWLLGVGGPFFLLLSGNSSPARVLQPGALAIPFSIVVVGSLIGGLYGALMGLDGAHQGNEGTSQVENTLLMVHARSSAEAWDARAILQLHGGTHIVSFQVDAGTDQVVGVGVGGTGTSGTGGTSTHRQAA